MPTYKECRPGDVVHLPLQEPAEDSIIWRKLNPNGSEQPWNHPAVIIGKIEEDGKQCLRIRLCTSFGGRRIDKCKEPRHRNFYVLVDNKQDNTTHNSTRLTTLAPGSDKFTRRTYVNLSYGSEYFIEYKYLESWGPKLIQLDAESTQRIIDCRSS
ncbi:hypothetical protein N0V83_008866 [Neocucurbitaria cava]|uniref:Uncharacterized protein n=1 Tax=Neocucurbitaria cava TaxID=798079 RepID=A0A9W8Y4B6_9PLEO|nr:hypothetical protein N0V83_008866 [Neocucurbitaria cava]